MFLYTCENEIYIVNIEFDESKGIYEANLRNATKAKKK